jgi:phosphoserine phosphatase
MSTALHKHSSVAQSTTGATGNASSIAITATLFYKSNLSPSHRAHADKPTAPNSPLPPATLEALRRGAVPTENLDAYPLEPPTPGPDPLDNLYGAYLSQSCVTDFLQTLGGALHQDGKWNDEEANVRRRALDSETWPRVMEIEFCVPTGAGGAAKEGALPLLQELRNNEAISRFERSWDVECVFQRNDVFRRYKRLAVFDMDSTLIQQEVIDEIARELGVEDQVSAITHAAMNGELDFEGSLRKRVALLKGTPATVFEKLKARIELMPGARELVTALKRLGYKTAVLSGGFVPLTGWLAMEVLGLDYFHANHLVVSSDGKTLTGELEGEIVHAERKRAHVMSIAEKEGISLDQVFVVGDGANDLPMMKVAGLGIAFNAKARVQLEAPARLNSSSLVDVLYLLGISKSEQEELLSLAR